MMEVLEWLNDNSVGIYVVLTSLVSVMAAIAALTPTPKDNEWAKKARKVVDFFGFNFLNAKNKQSDKQEDSSK